MNGMTLAGMATIPPCLILTRGVQDAALTIAVGVLGFRCLIAPRWDRSGWTACLAVLVAILAGAVWFLAEAANTAGTTDLGETLAAVSDFVVYVPFARFLLLRLVLLMLAGMLAGWPWLGLACAVAAAGLQPWLGHASQIGLAPTVAEVLHVMAAGLWLGGLPALLMALRRLPAIEHRPLLIRFGQLGAAAVVVLIATGFVQAGFLVGGWNKLLTTRYGGTLMLKLVLFAFALAAAAANRFLFAPRLNRVAWAPTALRASIAIEAMIGFLILLAAGWLASQAPGM